MFHFPQLDRQFQIQESWFSLICTFYAIILCLWGFLTVYLLLSVHDACIPLSGFLVRLRDVCTVNHNHSGHDERKHCNTASLRPQHVHQEYRHREAHNSLCKWLLPLDVFPSLCERLWLRDISNNRRNVWTIGYWPTWRGRRPGE